MINKILFTIALVFPLFIFSIKKDKQKIPVDTSPTITQIPVDYFTPKVPVTNITNKFPGHLSYQNINKQIRKWEEEAKDLVDIGTYGNTPKGNLLTYVKITNELLSNSKNKILIMCCIHGNEENATDVGMVYLSSLLSNYKEDRIKKLLDENEIYFIPVVNPDSYNESQREINGLDPNRDFINKRLATTVSLQEFFNKIKFNKAMSVHSHGRMLLIPFGYTNERCGNHDEILSLAKKMASTSQYRILRACELYGVPITGGELDWFYLNGAKISIVQEIGVHQGPFEDSEINYEFNRTWESFLVFLEH
jgi:hypothetical protein